MKPWMSSITPGNTPNPTEPWPWWPWSGPETPGRSLEVSAFPPPTEPTESGLFTVALSSSRDSTLETALSQIVLHATSTYDRTTSSRSLAYSYGGVPVADSSPEKHFQVDMTARPADPATIPTTSTNLHLLTLAISSPSVPGVTNVVHSTVFVP